ncbi:leucine-rich repeat-containing protein kinase family protein [Altericista sp. CCNU0014]|uniref:leucine-rich repeat-containing protein kinase family protein n=1 Tax=Altericista sp. CCNU0014 TaxID=3082949 RepID=UPI00384E3DFE
MSTETLDLLRAGQLTGTQKLSLACGLTRVPSEVFDLAESLEVLDLSNNSLKALPDDFERLQNLKAVFFINNEFEEIPEVLARCPKLRIVGFKSNRIRCISETALPPTLSWLILTQNELERLPQSIGNFTHLQKFMLAGNRLRSLPESISNCQNLELIRLSANCLTELPPWLLALPRLSWLAYAGNPFCAAREVEGRSPLSTIDWQDLALENTLGEGASGVISEGLWQVTSTETQRVAIKVFKGRVTSDGLPADEMQACLAAGSHPNLANVLGKVENHPENKSGLVLSLIPPDYSNLGGPPSLDTCTRDTYAPETSFSLPSILRIARGIAAAAAHLHRQGIMHGDLYAHNILTNDEGDSLLGDFGAASFYERSDVATGAALERLEVRAFGCLLEDLLDRCDEHLMAESQVIEQLRLIEQDCIHPIPSQRPLFADICDRLARFELKADPIKGKS